MEKKSLAFFPATLLLLALMLSAFQPGNALAQAYGSQLTFLENFAVKLYDRGDIVQSQKEFQRILTIDPDSATAKKYLAQIAKGPTPSPVPSRTALDKANSISGDIQSLRGDIQGYERDLAMLESLIRNLITENDNLYMSLSKRSREVMDLREKAYGIRYADQYKEGMAALPPDRVPQNLHRADEILPGLYNTPSSASLNNITDHLNAAGSEITALQTDIAKDEQDLKDLIAKGASGKNVDEYQRLLKEKRDALVEKNLALMEKRDRLVGLKDEVSSINADLKTANNRYLDLIEKIDKYYLTIKAEAASKNYVDQKMFSELLTDYTQKAAELEALRASIAGRDAKLTDYKAPLASQDEKLKTIDQGLVEKENELIALRAQIAYANKAADGVDSQVKTIQTLLQESDSDMAGLADSITKIKSLIRQEKTMGLKKAHPAGAPVTTNDNRAKARELTDALAKSQQETSALQARLTEKDRSIDALRQKLTEAERKMTDLDVRLNAKEENILTLEERIAAKDDESRKLRKTIEATPTATAPAPSTGEAESLIAVLAQRDQKIADLSNKLKNQDSEVVRLSGLLEEEKNKLEENKAMVQKDLRQTRTDLQSKELDVKERELALEQTKATATQRATALVDAEVQIRLLEEKLAALETKQKAIRSIVEKRDEELAKMASTLTATKNDLIAAQKQITTLTKGNKDTDAVNRLKDELEKRDNVIADLQERINAKDRTIAEKDAALKQANARKAAPTDPQPDRKKIPGDPKDKPVAAPVSPAQQDRTGF